MSLLANSNAIEDSGYTIARSLRFRSSASAYLSRTFASSATTFTFSAWIKRGKLSSVQNITGSVSGSYPSAAYFYFNSSDQLVVGLSNSSNNSGSITTTAIFRDPSAWYHVVLASTSGGTIYLYVNNVQVGSASVGSGYWLFTNIATYSNTIGQYGDGRNYYDGYLAEVNFIDGQALTPSSFGQTDPVTGVWQPKKYTGTYGTNGFYLNFSDNTSATTLAYDKSGNGNNWTANNISTTAGATYDSMTDVPTLTSASAANYCVLNPLNKPSAFTLSNGNLNLSSTVDNNNCVGTFGVTSGKWYFEFVPTNMSSGASVVGIAKDPINTATYIGGSANSWGYHPNGMKFNNASGSAYGASYTDNDVIGVALDVDGGSLTFYKNGTSQGVAFSGLAAGTYFANVQSNNLGASYVNFGQRPFSYTPPTGFKALNTFNLPDPTIKKGNQYMDATTYTGTGSTLSVTNSGSMKPDFVWVKDRTTAYNHNLIDSVRGGYQVLRSSSTDAESTETNGISSFNSNGYTVGTLASANSNGDAYVAWQWKAGGTAVTNTAGSITSQVSANPTAGFSVVTYTGTGANATVGHGLGVAPKMVIVKDRTAARTTDQWPVYHSGSQISGADQILFLNSTVARTTASTVFNNTTPTSAVFSVGTWGGINYSGDAFVAYCFSEIAGYSKFGSYTGNGSSDGPFVYCGFRPKYILWKRADSTADWTVFDTSRDTYNVAGPYLNPNTSAAELTDSTVQMDLLSNGFKVRGTWQGANASGGTFIFAAFAENPFKYSNAR